MAKLELDGKQYELPEVVGSEGEHAIDISALRSKTGYITLDDGYGNTGSCISKVTFIDGEKGILRYRGIPIEELAEKSTFVEAAYLLIWGKLPTLQELNNFSQLADEKRDAPRRHEISLRGLSHARAPDGDTLLDDQCRGMFCPSGARTRR